MKDIEKKLSTIDFSQLSKNEEALLQRIFDLWDKRTELTDDELDEIAAAGSAFDVIGEENKK